MKNLKKTFVIVEQSPNTNSEYFQGLVSFDKEKMDKKCSGLNRVLNAKWKKNYAAETKRIKSKTAREKRMPFVETVKYIVKDLFQAIEDFEDMVYDSNTVYDDSI